MTAPKPKLAWTTEELDNLIEAINSRINDRLAESEQVYADATADVVKVQEENEARLDQALNRRENAFNAYMAEIQAMDATISETVLKDSLLRVADESLPVNDLGYDPEHPEWGPYADVLGVLGTDEADEPDDDWMSDPEFRAFAEGAGWVEAPTSDTEHPYGVDFERYFEDAVKTLHTVRSAWKKWLG